MKPSNVAAAAHPGVPVTTVQNGADDAMADYERILAAGPALPPPAVRTAIGELCNRPGLLHKSSGPALAGTVSGLAGPDVSRYASKIVDHACGRDATTRALVLLAGAAHIGAGRGGKRLAGAWLNLLGTFRSELATFNTLRTKLARQIDAAITVVYPDGLTGDAVRKSVAGGGATSTDTVTAVAALRHADGALTTAEQNILAGCNYFNVNGLLDADVLLNWLEHTEPDVYQLRGGLTSRLTALLAADIPDLDAAAAAVADACTRFDEADDNGNWYVPTLWAPPGHTPNRAVSKLLLAILGPVRELSSFRVSVFHDVCAATGYAPHPDDASAWLADAPPTCLLAAGIVASNFDDDTLRRTAVAHLHAAGASKALSQTVNGAWADISVHASGWLYRHRCDDLTVAWLLRNNPAAAFAWLTEGRGGATEPSRARVAAVADLLAGSEPDLTWVGLHRHCSNAKAATWTPDAIEAMSWVTGSSYVFDQIGSYTAPPTQLVDGFVALLAEAAGTNPDAWNRIDQVAAVCDPQRGASIADLVDEVKQLHTPR